jgi:hypothetical protein
VKLGHYEHACPCLSDAEDLEELADDRARLKPVVFNRFVVVEASAAANESHVFSGFSGLFTHLLLQINRFVG